MVRIDGGAARMGVHGDNDRVHARLGAELLEVRRHAAHAYDHAVDGERG